MVIVDDRVADTGVGDIGPSLDPPEQRALAITRDQREPAIARPHCRWHVDHPNVVKGTHRKPLKNSRQWEREISGSAKE